MEKTLGTRVAQLRANRNFTQEKLAEAAGISKNYVSKIERNLSNPRLGVLERLACVLEVQVGDFYERSTDISDQLINAIIKNLYKLTERQKKLILAMVTEYLDDCK